eukprot:comp20074_c0_seq1/m.39452 comp20074_c0_seq1/g.39452  ORF comp20074_c0_seq1/g.39452 comp20074_c0_seq1/m.39452 type:complete len:457 (-) comp20074_c0_seq1:38-1408(-)
MARAAILLLVFCVSVFARVELPSSLPAELQAIINAAKANPTRGWDRLAYWTDSVGSRISGSAQLEKGLDLALSMMQKEGFSNVHGENATIPKWVRGDESLVMTSPYYKKLAFLSLGTSVGTNGGTITAPIVVVETFEELANVDAKGKIVVFNQQCDWKKEPTGCYGITAKFRVNGAAQAAKYGAVASLTRSLTGYSLYTPHTGVQDYGNSPVQIPTACITVEDAELFSRLYKRGVPVTLALTMQAQNYAPVPSRNIIAEIPGSVYPEQVVLIGGHTDSWDVGQGAEDDGAGFMVSWEALSLIQSAGLKPKRTIRLIGWVCEEFGGIGAQQYYNQHADEAANMSIAMESDLGIFNPFGLQFTGSPAATQIIQQIMSYAAPLNASAVIKGGEGEDSSPWMNAGVPVASPYNDASLYFNYHHTNADMMTHVPVESFEQSAAVWAIAAYGIAALDDLLPR